MRLCSLVNNVPTASPCINRTNTSGSRPLATTVAAPLKAARLAGSDFGVHAAGAHRAAHAAGHAFQIGMLGSDAVNQPRLRIFARVAVVKALLVGENHQSVGLHQIGHQSAERVVVAQLDFIGGNGVVFIDNRHNAVRQQGSQGAAGVEIAGAVAQSLHG